MSGDSSPRTVLVVDDERELANLYSDLLSLHYNVLVAFDGETAVEKMSDCVDVVLLDRHMRGMSGDEALEYILQRNPNCMVAFVSGIDPEDDILDTEIDMYLRKPIQIEQLRKAVETLLRRQTFGDEERRLLALAEKRDILGKEGVESQLPSHLLEKVKPLLSSSGEQVSLSATDRSEIGKLLS